MIVVDTNVIVGLWLPNSQDEFVYEVLKKDSDWIAPILWKSEFRNVLALYMRKGFMDFTTALQVLQEAENLMHSKEYEVNSTQVMSLVQSSNCSAYDCEFIALAKDLNITLVTFDKKMVSGFSDVAVFPRDF